jgi:hypothetical protein
LMQACFGKRRAISLGRESPYGGLADVVPVETLLSETLVYPLPRLYAVTGSACMRAGCVMWPPQICGAQALARKRTGGRAPHKFLAKGSAETSSGRGSLATVFAPGSFVTAHLASPWAFPSRSISRRRWLCRAKHGRAKLVRSDTTSLLSYVVFIPGNSLKERASFYRRHIFAGTT